MTVRIWKDRGQKSSFRVQTDEKNLHILLQKDSRFQFIGEGFNFDAWIYKAEFPSFQDASDEIETLKNDSADA